MSGPPRVLLHGFLGRGHDFGSWGEQALALDLPGHGNQPSLAEGATFDNVVDATRERIRSALGDESYDLVGYSMGGRIALGLLARGTDPIRRAAIAGAHPGIESPAERAGRALRDRRLAERIRSTPLPTFLAEWYQQPLFGRLHQHPEFARWVEQRAKNDPQGLAGALLTYGTGRQPPLWDPLAKSKSPILLIAGALDSKYIELNTRLADHCATARCHVIPDAGHSVHIEQPAQFRRVVDDFLAGHQE